MMRLPARYSVAATLLLMLRRHRLPHAVEMPLAILRHYTRAAISARYFAARHAIWRVIHAAAAAAADADDYASRCYAAVSALLDIRSAPQILRIVLITLLLTRYDATAEFADAAAKESSCHAAA